MYALDTSEPERQARARKWLSYVTTHGLGLLSTQALSELASVCLHRLQPRWTPTQVSEHLLQLATAMEVLPVTSAVVIEALRGVREHHLSFFDAQMWAQAKLNQVPYLLTEDMDTGATIDGVMIVDPFEVEPPSLDQTSSSARTPPSRT